MSEYEHNCEGCRFAFTTFINGRTGDKPVDVYLHKNDGSVSIVIRYGNEVYEYESGRVFDSSEPEPGGLPT